MNSNVTAAPAPQNSAQNRFFPEPAQQSACIAALKQLLASVSGSYASVLATIDGKPVAHAANEEWRPVRVAAIAGSLCALGETMCKELNQRGCRNVMIETDQGVSVVQRLPEPASRLILLTSCNRETNLGTLLTYTRSCANAIARIATP
jgi:uncharacterized protein